MEKMYKGKMWLLTLVLSSVILLSRGEDFCIVEDFKNQSHGLFSLSCSGLQPFSVEKYEGSDIPIPEGSNGYFLTTPFHTEGSCTSTNGRVKVDGKTEIIFKYYSIGQAGYCLAFIRSTFFTTIAQIPVDDARYWRTLSVAVPSAAIVNIEIECGMMGDDKLAIDSIIFKNVENCPKPVATICHYEEFGMEDTGIFAAECPGWTPFITGSYSDFPFPKPEHSNGYFLSSQQTVFGTCMKTKENIYIDNNSETVFKYFVYGNSTKCILSLVKAGVVLASETILMNNAQEWKTLSLRMKNPAIVGIVAQCAGSLGGKLVIDQVSVESASGNCDEYDAITILNSKHLLYNVISNK